MAGRRVIEVLTLSARVERKRETYVELEDFRCGVSWVFGLDRGGLQIGPGPDANAGVGDGAGKV